MLSVVRAGARRLHRRLRRRAYEPVGCARCGHSGYKGRIGLYEVMPITDEIRELTVERASADEIREDRRSQQGMRPLRDDGFEKVKNGHHVHRRSREGHVIAAAGMPIRRDARWISTSQTSCSQVMERGASDLHITAGSPADGPRARPAARAGLPGATPQDTREVVYSILTNDQRKRLENDWQIDFAYSIPGHGALPRQRLLPARRRCRRRVPPDPERDAGARATSACRRCSQEFTKKPRGFVLVTGPTGSGKSTTLAAMLDPINEERHEHILTIEDPIEFLHTHKKCIVNQREIGADAQSFALGAQGRAAPGPRRDPRRRDARPRDDLHRADRGRDRPPRLRHPAHAGHGRRPSTASSTCSRPTSSSRSACSCRSPLQGIVTQQLLPTADGQGRVVATEVLVPTPAVRNLIREGKTHQIYSALQTGAPVRHADDGHGAGRSSCASSKITRELAEARSSTPEELRRLLGHGRGRPRESRWRPTPSRRSTSAGAPTKGEIEADDKQAVASQLRSRGPDRRRHRGAGRRPAPATSSRASRRSSRTTCVIATRQLSTMVVVGHVAAARAVRDRGADREREAARASGSRCARTSRRASRSPTRCARHPEIFNELYVAMVAAGETGGILDETLLRVADQLEKDAALRRQIKAAMVYPSLIGGFAFVVLFALVTFLVPVFEKIFKDFGGELPADHEVHGRGCRTSSRGSWYVLYRGDLRRGLGCSAAGRAPSAAAVSGTRIKLQVPDEDRRHRPEGRAGALLAHVLGADRRRRADARGDRHHRQDVRQQGHREGDGGRPRLGQEGRHDRRADARRARGVPGHGHADDRRGRGDRRAGRDVAKVADFYEDEVEAAVKALTSILEPVMIVVVGGIVGFIVISMYMPMFKVYDSIK